MLQSVSKSSSTQDINIDSSSKGSKHPSINNVVELELLEERTPTEWLPTHYNQYTQRIHEFESWLCDQEEDVIAIVGHSQYFRSMLGLKSKFYNVDVWKLQFDVDLLKERHSNKRNVDADDTNEEKKNDIKGNENDDDDESKEPVEKGIVTKVDGVSLEDLELPQGWSGLKHLYRYDPDYED